MEYYYQTEDQKQKPLRQFAKSQFLRRAIIFTKLVVSVSVFSLFFTHSSLLSFLHYFNFYFSTLPIKLFSHTLDKNCTFLLCNGLLVFLAKYSGLFSSSSSSSSLSSSSSNKYNKLAADDHHESFKNYEDDDHYDGSQSQVTVMETGNQVPLLEKEDGVLKRIESMQQNAMEVREAFESKREEAQQEEENEEFKVGKHEEQQVGEETRAAHDEDGQQRGGCFFIEEAEPRAEEEALIDEQQESNFFIEEAEAREAELEEEEEEEEANGMLSTEELNKKFEDFIRKMKEELRIEARQQLIMV